MRCVKVVFSPTGGTQRVADAIAGEWGEHIDSVDLTDVGNDYSKVRLQEGDIVLVAVPSYGGRVPALATERLRQIRGNHARCILVCVYGNRAYEDTLVEMQDTAEECGFRVVAAIAAIAEHSIMHQYAAGRPDAQDVRELQDFAKKIMEKLGNNDIEFQALKVPGNRPYKKSGGIGLVPKADKKCVSCGLCAQACPTQAISRDNIKEADPKKCISCMRCVVRCPESARKVNGMMVSAAALAMKKVCTVKKENELFL